MLESFANLGPNEITFYLALMLLGGALLLPIPEDLPLLLAGAAAQQGRVNLFVVSIVCYVAVIIGDVSLYWIGRWFGVRLLRWRWLRARMSIRTIRQVRTQLHQQALWTILVARHLFHLRSVTFLSCGILRMNFVRFLICDAIAALISAPVFIAIGYFASEQLDEVLSGVGSFKNWSVLVLLVILLSVVWRVLRARRAKVDIESVGASDRFDNHASPQN